MVLKHSSSKDKFSFEQLENLITLCLPQFIFKLTSHLCDHLFIFLEILWQSTSQTKLWSSAPFKLYRGCEMHSLLLLHRCLLRRFETVEGVCKVHHWRQGQVFVQKKIDAHSYRIQISPVLVRTYQDSNTWPSLFFYLVPSSEETSFLTTFYSLYFSHHYTSAMTTWSHYEVTSNKVNLATRPPEITNLLFKSSIKRLTL